MRARLPGDIWYPPFSNVSRNLRLGRGRSHAEPIQKGPDASTHYQPIGNSQAPTVCSRATASNCTSPTYERGVTAQILENPILAVYPFSRGFAFVLFEGPESPFDWGVKEIKEKHKNVKTLDEIKKLIDQYRPEAIIIEETGEKGSRRSSRIRKLYRMLVHLSVTEYVDLYRYPDSAVKKYFASIGAHHKYEIAKAIANLIPAFAHRMPRIRKAWMGADPRQGLFDAAALGLVYYASRGMLSPYDELSS